MDTSAKTSSFPIARGISLGIFLPNQEAGRLVSLMSSCNFSQLWTYTHLLKCKYLILKSIKTSCKCILGKPNHVKQVHVFFIFITYVYFLCYSTEHIIRLLSIKTSTVSISLQLLKYIANKFLFHDHIFLNF